MASSNVKTLESLMGRMENEIRSHFYSMKELCKLNTPVQSSLVHSNLQHLVSKMYNEFAKDAYPEPEPQQQSNWPTGSLNAPHGIRNTGIRRSVSGIKYEDGIGKIFIVDSDDDADLVKTEYPIDISSENEQRSENPLPTKQTKRKSIDSQSRKRKRSADKSPQCKVCLKTFVSESYLVEHRKSHLDQFPIHCRKCLEDFTNENDRSVHEMQCHKRLFKCSSPACKFFSTFQGKLKRHSRVHRRSSL